MEECRNIDGLISRYYSKHPDGHYFDPDTLKFFGERRSDMRLLKERAEITDISGQKHRCYVVSRLQRKHPCGPRRSYAYFDVETLEDVVV